MYKYHLAERTPTCTPSVQIKVNCIGYEQNNLVLSIKKDGRCVGFLPGHHMLSLSALSRFPANKPVGV